MPRITCYLTLLLPIFLVIFTVSTPAAFADEENETNAEATQEERASTGDPDQFNIGEIVGEIAGDKTPIGIVDEVDIEGNYKVKKSVIMRGLTFDIGDEITQADLDLSKKRLLQLNGLFWYAEFKVEPSEEEGHVKLILTVNSRRTYYGTPAQSGAAIGDRNFFGTGKGVGAGYFSVDDATYAFIHLTDPQWLGGRNTMMYELHLIEGDIVTRTDLDFSSGEEYLYEKRGGYLRYTTRWNEDIIVVAGLKVENVSTEVKTDPYPDKFSNDTFYLSDAWIPEGTLVTWTLGLGKGSYNSALFPTEGYTLWFNSDHSYDFLLSDFNFSRYTFRATKYYGLGKSNKQAVAFKGEYGFETGSHIPNYELHVVDFQIRGMGGASDRGKSYIAFSGEYRFYIWPDVLQGVAFVDTGRAWDDISIGFDDFETSYGVGVRYQALKHFGFNILIRADYSLGPYDNRWYLGLGQAF